MGCQSIAPSALKFAGTHLYTWVERGTVRVNASSALRRRNLKKQQSRRQKRLSAIVSMRVAITISASILDLCLRKTRADKSHNHHHHFIFILLNNLNLTNYKKDIYIQPACSNANRGVFHMAYTPVLFACLVYYTNFLKEPIKKRKKRNGSSYLGPFHRHP